MKRKLLFLFSILAVFALVACGNKVDEATAKKYTGKAEEVILLLSEGKYEEVHAMFNKEMEDALPVGEMDALTPLIEEAGKFEKINKASVEEKDGYYVTVTVAKYSKKNRIFTITFDENDNIAGLYVK